ncbi:hypothetical protein [Pacificoceanicola onchidii]|uniref:hypothetical protein n=1 Tax=Pacificoceanicola onchidii TaxID=2562685 RepID=UPI0010A67D09|nr:hypothetical protein [Pacificoceanicola onchidii]
MALFRTLFAAGLALCALPLPLAAQDGGDAGGVWLRLGLNQRFEATENADLNLSSEGRTTRAATALALVLSSETRTDFISLSFGASLRHAEGPDDEDDVSFALQAPRVELSYARSGTQSLLETRFAARTEEVSYLRNLRDFLNEDGTLPEEFETINDLIDSVDREAEGQRRTLSASAGVRFGIDGPVEGGLRLSAQHVDHFGTDPALFFDSESYTATGDLRLALTETLTLNSRLSYTEFHQDSSPVRETWALTLGLSQSRPRGTLSFSLGARQVEEGTSYTLNSGWSTELAGGDRLGFTLGASRSANGTDALTGTLSYNRPLPRGAFSAQLRRGLTSGTEESEELFTLASLGLTHEFGPLTSGQIGLSWIDTEDLAMSARTTRGALDISISHQFVQDWQISAGYRRSMLRDTTVGSGWAESDSLFVSINKTFSHRF